MFVGKVRSLPLSRAPEFMNYRVHYGCKTFITLEPVEYLAGTNDMTFFWPQLMPDHNMF